MKIELEEGETGVESIAERAAELVADQVVSQYDLQLSKAVEDAIQKSVREHAMTLVRELLAPKITEAIEGDWSREGSFRDESPISIVDFIKKHLVLKEGDYRHEYSWSAEMLNRHVDKVIREGFTAELETIRLNFRKRINEKLGVAVKDIAERAARLRP